MFHHSRRARLTLAATAVAFAWALLATETHAADASAWDEDNNAAMRLVAAPAAPETADSLRAGVEIRLSPGWKTYWRYPGDSGVPPRFSFQHSDNVRSVTVLWPAPQRFDDGAGGASVGYSGAVIFPLRVVRRDPRRPAMLRLDLSYAVCEKLCVPIEAKAELALPQTASALPPEFAATEERVPKRVALGAHGPLSIVSVTRENGTPPRVVVDVAAPREARVDLFAEGPTPEWALPLPHLVAGAPAGIHRFAFELDGLPVGAQATGAAITLTAVSDAGAIEVTSRLD